MPSSMPCTPLPLGSWTWELACTRRLWHVLRNSAYKITHMGCTSVGWHPVAPRCFCCMQRPLGRTAAGMRARCAAVPPSRHRSNRSTGTPPSSSCRTRGQSSSTRSCLQVRKKTNVWQTDTQHAAPTPQPKSPAQQVPWQRQPALPQPHRSCWGRAGCWHTWCRSAAGLRGGAWAAGWTA